MAGRSLPTTARRRIWCRNWANRRWNSTEVRQRAVQTRICSIWATRRWNIGLTWPTWRINFRRYGRPDRWRQLDACNWLCSDLCSSTGRPWWRHCSIQWAWTTIKDQIWMSTTYPSVCSAVISCPNCSRSSTRLREGPATTRPLHCISFVWTRSNLWPMNRSTFVKFLWIYSLDLLISMRNNLNFCVRNRTVTNYLVWRFIFKNMPLITTRFQRMWNHFKLSIPNLGLFFNKIFEIVVNLLLYEIRRRSCADSEHQSFSLKWIDGLCVKVEFVV